jgi:hypothetical protein
VVLRLQVKTVFSARDGDNSRNFADLRKGQDDARPEAYPRRLSPRLDFPGLGLGFSWIFLESSGPAWIFLGVSWSLAWIFWISLAFLDFTPSLFKGLRSVTAEFGIFSAPGSHDAPLRRERSRAEPKARIAGRGCGMETATQGFALATLLGNVHGLFRQAKSAPHATGQLRND